MSFWSPRSPVSSIIISVATIFLMFFGSIPISICSWTELAYTSSTKKIIYYHLSVITCLSVVLNLRSLILWVPREKVVWIVVALHVLGESLQWGCCEDLVLKNLTSASRYWLVQVIVHVIYNLSSTIHYYWLTMLRVIICVAH